MAGVINDGTPIFYTINDLAAHRGIPTFLPPSPRTVTPQSLDDVVPPSEPDAFSSLCSEYLTMLDKSSPELNLNAASGISNHSEEEAARAILSILRTGEPDCTLSLAHRELTDCDPPLDDSSTEPGGYLFSPMESPLDDFLSTPGLRNDDLYPDPVNPLIVEDTDLAHFDDTPLFDDAGLVDPPSSSAKSVVTSIFSTADLDDMYTISPTIPALGG